MKKQLAFPLFALLAILLSACSSTENAAPNVILILCDDLGYNDLSCYRATHPATSERPPTCVTPAIDRLAVEGMRFTDFYAGAAVCSPSRSALMTGRNASRVGIYNWIPADNPMHLRASEVSIAEMLKENGYTTGHFGKWHLTSENMDQPHPNDQGFDYSFFTYNNARPSHKDPENFFRNNVPEGPLGGYACQIVMDEALQWLDTLSGESPFFLNLWFNEPHRIVAAPEYFSSRHSYNQEYYGCIENMDSAVNRLITFLDSKDLSDNTLIIFTSDNGANWPHSNEPLRGEKAYNYEGGIREPFIVRYPGVVPPGTVNHAPGSFTDILPTLAEITGATLPGDRKLDGVSILENLKGAEDYPERESPIFFYRYFHDPITMLRIDDWCLLGYEELRPDSIPLNTRRDAKFKPAEGEPTWAQWGFQEGHMDAIPDQYPRHFELYNLREDRSQTRNIATQHPALLDSMIELTLKLKEEMVLEGGNWYE